jgi:pilus assembly protein CpaB
MDRQKALLMFGVAWISAALLTWFLYAKTKAPKEEKTAKVVAAARDLPPGTRLTKQDVRIITVIEKDRPAGALEAPAEVIGRALVYPVNANEAITAGRLSSVGGAEGAAAIIEPGKRAISVPYTDVAGASGLIEAKSRVDVLFTRTGNAVEAMTVTVLEDIEVLSVGRNIQATSATSAQKGTPAPGGGQNRTVTLIVNPEQAQKIELAKNQGRISLSLRNPTDRGVQQEPAAATMETIDPMLVVRAGGKRPPRLPGNLKDRKAWANLIGEDYDAPKPPPAPPKPPEKKEPPKPRLVVDVFRGEKHVQEIFQ